jgi:hypothetical protein
VHENKSAYLWCREYRIFLRNNQEMQSTGLAAMYRQRASVFGQQALAIRSRYDRLSWLRLIVFLVGVAFFLLLAGYKGWVAVAFAATFLYGFYRFVNWHQRLLRQATHLQALEKLNMQEALAVEGQWSSYADGAEYGDSRHPYAADLDIFGPYSLFQYLNRTVTKGGGSMLADWLAGPAEADEIAVRQAAAAELAAALEWRQQLQALGDGLQEPSGRVAILGDWLASPAVAAGNPRLGIVRWLAPLWFVGIMLAWVLWISWPAVVLLLSPVAWLLWTKRDEIDRLQRQTEKVAGILACYAQIIKLLEESAFEQPHLRQLQRALAEGEGGNASAALQKLAYYLGQLDVRNNIFAVVLQVSVVWDLQWVWQIDRWKMQYGDRLPGWFASMAQFEALASLANLRHNQPDWVYPQLTEETRLEAEAVGHPLLHDRKRVTNDVVIGSSVKMHLITGSNMAGKSTWLRTLGINIVLGQAGAVVCARRMQLSQWQVFTSMRTQDDLQESTSGFFAELRRLQQLMLALDASGAPGGRPVFYILDEILKGTNSRDRHAGARALIGQLIRKNGAGLVATHDLELTDMEAEAAGLIENWAMEVAIEGDELRFDYRIHRGVSQSFSASLLMKKMGLLGA